ncbi:MAG: aldo/keto reductase [Bacteroidales bacterium]|nr:aldo/keto reductase [Bacteroidales bacterium]
MKITDIKGTFKLLNGVEIPYFGLGVYNASEGTETYNAVTYALEAGYRLIDTATLYYNEKSVGKAVADSTIPREEVFITTKVWNTDQGYQRTKDAFQRSLEYLRVEYIDLYLIHWPVSNLFFETWQAIEELYSEGLVKAIGVSNFRQYHLTELINNSKIKPMINQVEFHPYYQQNDLVKFCQANDIVFEAWAPIMRGRVSQIPEIVSIARKYNKSPIQVVLRWNLQRDIITIPKSSKKERIISNAEFFDFELNEEEITLINSLDKGVSVL